MTPFRSVAAYAYPNVGAFGLGIVAELFGCDRTEHGLPRFDFALCAERPGLVRTDGGLTLHVADDLDRFASADLVFVTGWGEDRDRDPSPTLLRALRSAYDNGAILAGNCTGAYLIAASGLLDGGRATTHWRYAADLALRYPAVRVEPEVLYIDEGRVVTGAGSAACIDLGLYLLRREHGAAVAAAIARDMVVPLHREGGQAQYVQTPVPAGCDDERLGAALAWAQANLDSPVTVDQLAARALMSPRSFARRFKASTGTTPHAWLLGQRLHRAEELLETMDLPVEEVARRVGFGTAAALREHFVRRRGVPPRDYRRTFAAR
jgi:transcriptional regulator GlxA family with amidase domain